MIPSSLGSNVVVLANSGRREAVPKYQARETGGRSGAAEARTRKEFARSATRPLRLATRQVRSRSKTVVPGCWWSARTDEATIGDGSKVEPGWSPRSERMAVGSSQSGNGKYQS